MFDFFVIMGYFIFILHNGSEVNKKDLAYKAILVGIAKDCNETKTFCDNGRIWARKTKVGSCI